MISEGELFAEDEWGDCASLDDIPSEEGEESEESGPTKKEMEWSGRYAQLLEFKSLVGHCQVFCVPNVFLMCC
jgi:hypothetical protein